MTEPDRLVDVAPALREAAGRFGTPLYVTDAAALGAAAEELRTAFPDPWIRQYSVKANDVTAIVARLGAAGLGANVVSRGEWAIASRAGIANARITLEGVGKTDADLRAAVRAASAGETASLAQIARKAGATMDVLLRFNPAVEPETQPGLAVGTATSKFGLADDELAGAIVAGGGATGPLRWRGLHLHVGSQLGAVDAWRDAVRRALALGAVFGGRLPAFDTLDLGGGFPVQAFGESAPRPERFARELPALLEAVPAGRRPTRLAVEPGRFLVARSGWVVARVLHVRERGAPMIVLDAGMTELIRPALYGARHPIVALTSFGRPADGPGVDRPSPGDRAADVHGPICESTDELGWHSLPSLRRGDLVAIRDAGAYGASQASTYNGRPRPPQVILETDGELTLARRRGSVGSLG